LIAGLPERAARRLPACSLPWQATKLPEPNVVELEDEVCMCFHVSKRKLRNFLRIERPKRPGQMSECFGAGTGCGWCRTYLEAMFRRWSESPDDDFSQEPPDEPTSGEHALRRSQYVRSGGGTPPPGATPIEPQSGP
jgi:bacterioferritin-associated ferredoxin